MEDSCPFCGSSNTEAIDTEDFYATDDEDFLDDYDDYAPRNYCHNCEEYF